MAYDLFEALSRAQAGEMPASMADKKKARLEQARQEKRQNLDPNWELHQVPASAFRDSDTLGSRGQDYRLNYGPWTEGKAFDAFETEKPQEWWDDPNHPERRERLNNQKMAAASVLDKPLKDVTDQDVFDLGRRAKEEMIQGLKAAPHPGEEDHYLVEMAQFGKDAYNRPLAEARDPVTGKSLMEAFNTPEFNAQYNSKYNAARLAEDMAREKERKDKLFFDPEEGTGSYLGNVAMGMADVTKNIVLTSPVLAGARLSRGLVKEGRDINYDKSNEKTLKSIERKENVNELIDYHISQQDRDTLKGLQRIRQLEERKKQNAFTPEEQALMQGREVTDEFSGEPKTTLSEYEKYKRAKEVKEYEEDVQRFEQTVLGLSNNFSEKVDRSASERLQKSLSRDWEGVKEPVDEAVAAWKDGNKVEAVSKFIEGTAKGGWTWAKATVDNPDAILPLIGESLAHAVGMSNPVTGIIVVNDFIQSNYTEFEKEHGRAPTGDELAIVAGAGIAEGYLEKLGAKAVGLGNVLKKKVTPRPKPKTPPKERGKLAKGTAYVAGKTARVGGGAIAEGLTEAGQSLISQYGVKQDVSELSAEEAFTEGGMGFAAGAGIKGAGEAISTPAALVGKGIKAAKSIGGEGAGDTEDVRTWVNPDSNESKPTGESPDQREAPPVVDSEEYDAASAERQEEAVLNTRASEATPKTVVEMGKKAQKKLKKQAKEVADPAAELDRVLKAANPDNPAVGDFEYAKALYERTLKTVLDKQKSAASAEEKQSVQGELDGLRKKAEQVRELKAKVYAEPARQAAAALGTPESLTEAQANDNLKVLQEAAEVGAYTNQDLSQLPQDIQDIVRAAQSYQDTEQQVVKAKMAGQENDPQFRTGLSMAEYHDQVMGSLRDPSGPDIQKADSALDQFSRFAQTQRAKAALYEDAIRQIQENPNRTHNYSNIKSQNAANLQRVLNNIRKEQASLDQAEKGWYAFRNRLTNEAAKVAPSAEVTPAQLEAAHRAAGSRMAAPRGPAPVSPPRDLDQALKGAAGVAPTSNAPSNREVVEGLGGKPAPVSPPASAPTPAPTPAPVSTPVSAPESEANPPPLGEAVPGAGPIDLSRRTKNQPVPSLAEQIANKGKAPPASPQASREAAPPPGPPPLGEQRPAAGKPSSVPEAESVQKGAEQARKVVQDLAKKFRVTWPKLATDNLPKSKSGKYHNADKTIRLAPDLLAALGNPAKDPELATQALETLLHEFGHHLDYELLSNLSEADTNKLKAAYADWKTAQQGKSLADQLKSRYTPARSRGLRTRERADQEVEQLIAKHGQDLDYITSYKEWAADNIARYLLGQAMDEMAPEARTVLEKVAKQVRKVWKQLTKTYNDYTGADKTVEQLLQQHLDRIRKPETRPQPAPEPKETPLPGPTPVQQAEARISPTAVRVKNRTGKEVNALKELMSLQDQADTLRKIIDDYRKNCS